MLGGTYGFAENSWARAITENGVIIGSMFLVWRVWVAKDLLGCCIQSVKKETTLQFFFSVQPLQFYSLGYSDNQLTWDLQPLVVAYVLPQLFPEKLMLPETKVLLVTNYREDYQYSMLKFGEIFY